MPYDYKDQTIDVVLVLLTCNITFLSIEIHFYGCSRQNTKKNPGLF